MNASRLALIPLAHLQAELVAFPLASERGLELGLTSLHPGLEDETGDLWRSAEQALVTASPSVSVDELVAMRDDLWFRRCDPMEELPLRTYLTSVAERYLMVRGSVAVPRPEEDAGQGQLAECDARNNWRWLSLALPPDLLLAGLANKGRIPTKVDTVSPILGRRLMDDGFAEPHLHLNASLDFGRLWVNTVRGLADSDRAAEAFKSPGASFREGAELGAWLLSASIARYVLAAFLFTSKEQGDFSTYLQTVQDRLVDEQEIAGAAHIVAAFEDLYRGHRPSVLDYAALRSLYRFLIDVRIGQGPEHPDDLWAWDPIEPLVGGRAPVEVTPESRFVAKALGYMKRKPEDRAFGGLFWQVVRVRCLFYRHLVQRPMTPGLQWFVRFFERLKPARSGLTPALTARTAALLCGEGRGLRSLEVRLSPDAQFSTLYQEVRGFDKAFHSRMQETTDEVEVDGIEKADVDEAGIVFHLKRDRGGGWFKGRPSARWTGSEADPRIDENHGGNSTGYRYGRFYREARKGAMVAARLLCARPRSLEVVRGLDLCTDESGVPSWVMAPLLRYMRDAGFQASAALSSAGVSRASVSRRPPAPAPPLRMTVHAGEDFVHLMSGLRRLDEALDYLGLAEGDRLGHALSLGVEPRSWAERAGRVAIPQEERLFDLVWEWSWHSRQGHVVPGRDALIQREIAERSAKIFDEAVPPWELNTLVRDLHDETVLRHLGFPDGRPPALTKTDPLRHALAYLTSPEVFANGREIVWVDPASEVDALEHLQTRLRQKVGRMNLTIEVNPSSNLLIGHFGELGDHPLWRLAPAANQDGIPPLSVCIGSDDPLTFATTLPEEYQLLYDALMKNDCSNALAHDWLERARKAGMSSRFTLPVRGKAQHPTEFGPVSGDSLDLDPPP